MRGWAFVRGDLMRDFAALNKVELLPWDSWGYMTATDDEAATLDLEMMDTLADLSNHADTRFDDLRHLAESDSCLRIPEWVAPCSAASLVAATLTAALRTAHRDRQPPGTSRGLSEAPHLPLSARGEGAGGEVLLWHKIHNVYSRHNEILYCPLLLDRRQLSIGQIPCPMLHWGRSRCRKTEQDDCAEPSLEASWKRRDFAAAAKYIAADHVNHGPMTDQLPGGPEGNQLFVTGMLAAFPDTQYTIDKQEGRRHRPDLDHLYRHQ